jgi:tRNA A37 methylthiotransferase MiaB
VPPAQRLARTRALRELSVAKNLEFRRGQLGARCPAVVYRARERHGGRLVALTDNYIKVELDGPDGLLGRAIEVELDELDGPRTLARLRE